LNYTHQGKIDVIYIDPPYNTGNDSWKYNNRFVNFDDAFRHSKWLSFMKKRLCLSRKLLKAYGIIVVTIDDYEIATLRLLMDDIFGTENYLGTAVIRNNPSGRSTVRGFSINHEYALFYSNTDKSTLGRLPHTADQKGRYGERDEVGSFELENFRKNGTDSDRNARPKQFFPLVVNKRTLKLRVPNITWNNVTKSYVLNEKTTDAEEVLFPVNRGVEKVWKFGLERASASINEMTVKRTKAGFEIYRKKYLNDVGSLPRTWWDKPAYSARDNGTRSLTEISGANNTFNFPKAPEAVRDCLSVANLPKNGIVLDFFAGSGTTGQAVLELNKIDSGHRQFILCTNNEGKICTDVCHPRISKVIKGYSTLRRKRVDGLGGNLKYFKTAFVKNSISRDDLKIRITHECTEMLCLREGIFEEVKTKPDFRIFEQNGRIMGVYYAMERDGLADMKKELDNMKGEKILYCFTLDPLGLDKNDFSDWQGVRLEPIPQKILDIYEQIYEY